MSASVRKRLTSGLPRIDAMGQKRQFPCRKREWQRCAKADPTFRLGSQGIWADLENRNGTFDDQQMLGRAPKVGVLPLSVFGALLVSATRTILVIPVSAFQSRKEG